MWERKHSSFLLFSELCSAQVCGWSLRPSSGSTICQEDSQNSEKLLYSWLWFITVKGYRQNQKREKVNWVKSGRSQAQNFQVLPSNSHTRMHLTLSAIKHGNTSAVLPGKLILALSLGFLLGVGQLLKKVALAQQAWLLRLQNPKTKIGVNINCYIMPQVLCKHTKTHRQSFQV